MKNRVLRLAIVAVLVIAMVLTMAACGGNTPVESPSTTPTTAPTATAAPTATPTVAPTTSPAPTSDAATLAKDTFGIEFTGVTATYGDMQYLLLKADSSLIKNYTIKVKVDGISYEGEAATVDGTKTAAALKATFTTATFQTFGTDNYAGFSVYASDGKVYANMATIPDGKTFVAYAIPVKSAGDTVVEITVTVKDNNVPFGKFGYVAKDNEEYSLSATASIAKALAYVMIGNDAVKADATKTYAQAPVYVPAVEYDADTENINVFTWSNGTRSYDAYLEFVAAVTAAHAYAYVVETSTYKANEAGSVGLTLFLSSKNDTQENIMANPVDFAELSAPNFTFQAMDATKYVIDAYDWNAIRDVITSILDIREDVYNAAGNTNNLTTQYKLALNRYNALSDAQKAYFIRYNDVITGVGLTAEEIAASANVTDDLLANAEGDYNGYFTWLQQGDGTNVYVGLGATALTAPIYGKLSANLMIYLTIYLPTKLAKEEVISDWTAACKAANWTTGVAYGATANFSVNDDAAVAAYKAVDSYYTALSAADQAIVAVYGGAAAGGNYYQYNAAKAAFRAAEIEQVKVLIAGAVGGYTRAVKAISTLDTTSRTVSPIYKMPAGSSNAVMYFVNNAEVKALTAQAKAAFDKLTAAEQATIVDVFDTTDETIAGSVVTVDGGTAKFFYDMTADTDNTDGISYVKALSALTTMNTAVSYMEQVINYVNIENYKNAASVSGTGIYARLNTLVYGATTIGGTTVTTDFFNDTTVNYAMNDLIVVAATAPKLLDSVVAEYKAWIDYSLAFEAYKAEVVANLRAMITEEFTAANYESASEAWLDKANAATNPTFVALATSIMSETNMTVVSSSPTTGQLLVTSAQLAAAQANAAAVNTAKTFATIFAKSYETVEEFKEEFENVYNLDKAFALYKAVQATATLG